MKFKKVLIDGDIVMYSVGFATQKNIYSLYQEGAWTGEPVLVSSDKRQINEAIKSLEGDAWRLTHEVKIQPPLSAFLTIKNMIRKYQKMFETDDITVFLTGEGNFREKVATIQKYKGNRDGIEKPVNYSHIKKWLLKQPYTQLISGEEADDKLSIGLMEGGDDVVIVTDDKDLLNTPGWHYRPRKEELLYVTSDQADRNFYQQLLTGDDTDNIPGIKRMGPKTAQKALSDCNTIAEMERVVGLHYAIQYDDPEKAMVEIGQLLWMRRMEAEFWRPQFLGGPKCD